LVRPFFQNFKIPNWLSICLSVFHSITTSQTQRSVKYGQDRGEGPPFQRGTAALDPAGVALTLAPGREVERRAERGGSVCAVPCSVNARIRYAFHGNSNERRVAVAMSGLPRPHLVGGQGLTPDGGKGLRAGQHPGTRPFNAVTPRRFLRCGPAKPLRALLHWAC